MQAEACDAVLVARLRAAGAIVPGKTNTCEFANAAYNEVHGFTRNPWDPTRTAGANERRFGGRDADARNCGPGGRCGECARARRNTAVDADVIRFVNARRPVAPGTAIKRHRTHWTGMEW